MPPGVELFEILLFVSASPGVVVDARRPFRVAELPATGAVGDREPPEIG